MSFTNCRSVFLTGATGVVGGRVLYEILASTDMTIFCLVREGNLQRAKQRIANILRIYDPVNALREEFESRIVIIIGDLTKSRFNLKRKDYEELTQRVDQVFHVAANVNLVSDYKTLAEVNLKGTSEVIEFCLAGQIPMLHTSSYSIVGSKLSEQGLVFKENDLNIGQSFDDMDYERTKMEGEKLVHSAGTKGLKWVIVRLGDILGDSKTGCYPLTGTTNQGIYYDIIKTVVDTGISFFSEDLFYCTPVDYAARALLYLALSPEAYSQTFHLVNPEQRTMYDFINLIVDFGYRVKVISFRKYVDLFRDNRVQENGRAYSSSFVNLMLLLDHLSGSEEGPPEAALIDTTQAQKFLSKFNIVCPRLDINLMSTYLNYCISQKLIASPEDHCPLAMKN
jgi:thioester reductase-like protein